MRVLVMGAGAVGGYYGGVLAQQGHEVVFVARGAHLVALRERGLELRSGGGTARLHPVAAVASPAEAPGPIDLVLFTVKTYDTDGAAVALRPAVGPETAVLPLQNGVESVERLGRVLGAARVLAGTTTIVAALVAPGVVEESGPVRRITLAEPAGAVTPRLERIATALRGAGVEVRLAADARLALWEKFAPLAAHATITSACRTPVGPVRDAPEGRALYRTAVDEAIAVGRAAGVPLDPDFGERITAFLLGLPPQTRSSMERDFERGQRTELEQLTGTVIRLGREQRVPTPTFDALYAVLKLRAPADPS